MSGAQSYSLFTVPPSQINLIRRGDGVVIPPDPANANYQAYQAFIAGGGKPGLVPITQAMVDAAAFLAGGLTVTSTGSPAISGTYRCDGLTMAGIQAEVNAILLSGATPTFADGTASLNWPDVAGVGHTFTVAQFHELAMAVCNFVVQCAQYNAGLNVTPNPTVTIA